MGGIEANTRRQDDDHSGCDFEAANMLPLLVEDGDHFNGCYTWPSSSIKLDSALASNKSLIWRFHRSQTSNLLISRIQEAINNLT